LDSRQRESSFNLISLSVPTIIKTRGGAAW
jgi:hypothetical protein